MQGPCRVGNFVQLQLHFIGLIEIFQFHDFFLKFHEWKYITFNFTGRLFAMAGLSDKGSLTVWALYAYFF